jgi:hypothetical protein
MEKRPLNSGEKYYLFAIDLENSLFRAAWTDLIRDTLGLLSE